MFHTFHLVVVVSLEPRDGAPSIASLYPTSSLGAICRLEPGLIGSLPFTSSLHWCFFFAPSMLYVCWAGEGWGWGRGDAKGVTL